MTKDRVSLRKFIAHWFTYHPWLKVISFVLAIAVWLYVRDEITRFKF